MSNITRLGILILLLSAPALLFAQEAQQQEPVPGLEEQQFQAGVTRRLNDLIGTEITDQVGEIQGTIEDVVFSIDGEITHLAVEVAQTQLQPGEPEPGVQDQQQQPGIVGPVDVVYLVPIDRVTFEADGEVATLDVSWNELQGLQTLQDGELPADFEVAFAQPGVQEPGVTEAPMTPEETRYFLGSRVLDFAFVDPQGEDLGGVDDIMLDLGQNRVAYIAMAHGGLLGIGAELYAVPLDAIQDMNQEQEQLIVNFSQEQIDQQEAFDGDNWPTEAQRWEGTAPTGETQVQ